MKKLIPVVILFLIAFNTTLTAQLFDGYALYNELNESTAYLIDKDGDIAYTWSCDDPCNYALHMKEDGNLIRGAIYDDNDIEGAAVGGMVQEIDPSGNVVWEFVYSNSNHVSHHDLAVLPNGNVLLTAWEVVNSSALDDLGYTGSSNTRWATHIVEVQQDGTDGEIVWEWHIKDHMVQDGNSGLDNYGEVSEHPELLNINVATSGGGGGGGGMGNDWFHVNGIDYNPALDQIAFTSRFLSEIFIIDHSTTTEEAASHSGGNGGMGGDFLYRWGNPDNYDTDGDQLIPAAVHDVRWIKEGRPYAGYLQFFNNEGAPGDDSAVDAIDTPLNGFNYDLTVGESYGPESYTLRHICLDNANGQSASDRMTNGNIFVCLSMEYLYEADADGNLIWQYNAQPAKAFRFECEYPGIQALLADPCETPDSIEEKEINPIILYPNPSNTGVINITGYEVTNSLLQVEVFDAFGKLIVSQSNQMTIDISDQANGLYIVRAKMNSGAIFESKISLIK